MLNDSALIVSRDSAELLIKIEPQQSPVKAIEITLLISKGIYAEYCQLEENIFKAADLINNATNEAASPTAKITKSGQLKEIVVAKRKDAELEIVFSDDEMKAYAVITAAYGGSPIAFEDLVITLSQHNLTQSLHARGLDEFLEAANSALPGETTRFHIVSGTPPIDGEDSRFEYLVDATKHRKLKPQAEKNGKVNMHELGDILSVKSGAQLIRHYPPTPGMPGKTLFGEPITPNPGKRYELNVGEGTAISPTDRNILVSTRVGIPRELKNGMAIDDVLVLDNVDVSTGNIRFEGSVMISGDICEGLKVVANGCITVGGSVNSATLKAKGDITVANGITGKKSHSEQGGQSCHIISGGSVSARFIQYCDIKSNLGISAQTHILHSTMVTDANISVSNPTGTKGTLLGGSAVAGQQISAVELGGASGSKTLLSIEGILPSLRKTAAELNKSLRREHDLMKQLLSAHEKVGHLEQGQKKQQLLQQLKHSIDKKIAIIVNIRTQKAANDNAIKAFLAKASIKSIRRLQQGVEMSIDGKKITINREYQASETRIQDDKLLLAPAT